MPCSFDYLIYPYYPAYTMGCYQIVISADNRGSSLLFVLLVCECNYITKCGEMQPHSPSFSKVFINRKLPDRFEFVLLLCAGLFSK